MRFFYRPYTALSLAALFVLMPSAALAQSSGTYPAFPSSGTPSASPSSGTVGGLSNPLGGVTGVCQLIKIVLNVLLLIGVPVAMLYLVWAGAMLVMARGNPDGLKKARLNLMYTLGGIALFMGVWFLGQLLANTLGDLGVTLLGDCR